MSLMLLIISAVRSNHRASISIAKPQHHPRNSMLQKNVYVITVSPPSDLFYLTSFICSSLMNSQSSKGDRPNATNPHLLFKVLYLYSLAEALDGDLVLFFEMTGTFGIDKMSLSYSPHTHTHTHTHTHRLLPPQPPPPVRLHLHVCVSLWSLSVRCLPCVQTHTEGAGTKQG